MHLFKLWRSPSFRRESIEGEHSLVNEDQLTLVELNQLDQLIHLVEHSPRFKAGVVERFLALLDVLELDAMLLIGPLEQGRADGEFGKLPMEHYNIA